MLYFVLHLLFLCNLTCHYQAKQKEEFILNITDCIPCDIKKRDGDYIDGSGALICGVCHEPRTRLLELERKMKWVPVNCGCDEKEWEAAKEKAKMQEFQNHMKLLHEKYAISDKGFSRFTFAADDGANPKISEVCRKYAAKWDEMKANGIGILFYGSIGAGKSFLAAAIANELLQKMVPAAVTSFPHLLNMLTDFGTRQKIINHLQSFKLLVIDDLGAERDSSFASEQVFNVVDARVQSGLPLIVTTNLTLDEMRSAQTTVQKRIYDRVLEMCPIALRMTGTSRRTENAEYKKALAKKLLGFEGG